MRVTDRRSDRVTLGAANGDYAAHYGETILTRRRIRSTQRGRAHYREAIGVDEELKKIVQDCHLSLLIGSGLSVPYLSTLGSVESLLTELDARDDLTRAQSQLIRAVVYKKYFTDVAAKNPPILSHEAACLPVLEQYRILFRCWSEILVRRKTPLLSKELNVFTTNIDIFMERALEDLHVDYNDGFSGRLEPAFSLSNFKRSHSKRTLHYDNLSEVPVLNLCKLHGSLTWALNAANVTFSASLAHVTEVGLGAAAANVPDLPAGADLDALVHATAGLPLEKATVDFLKAYEQLLVVVNPTKEKFKHTLLNQTYYELLRIYSNELEKENAFLLVMGFSFVDEHIREITLRAANSNPTLLVWVIAHSGEAAAELDKRLNVADVQNRNLKIIRPDHVKDPSGSLVDKFKFDLRTINEKLMVPLRKGVSVS